MNPETLDEALDIFKKISSELDGILNEVESAVCPPFVWLSELKKITSKISLGAQDVFYENKGTFTGQISPTMLKNLGVKYVLIGHSEKRKFGGEQPKLINQKIKACLSVGITPVHITGDLGAQSIESEDFDIITKQLKEELIGLNIDDIKNILFTYEPVFAISKGLGTGKAVPQSHVVQVINFLRNFLCKTFNLKEQYVKILYGGSADANNCFLFLKRDEINGLLPGGASLVPSEFASIIRAAQNG